MLSENSLTVEEEENTIRNQLIFCQKNILHRVSERLKAKAPRKEST